MHADIALRGNFIVGVGLDVGDALRRELGAVHLEIHAGVILRHIAAGHLCAEVTIDQATEDMERRVHAHQGVTAIPVDLAVDG